MQGAAGVSRGAAAVRARGGAARSAGGFSLRATSAGTTAAKTAAALGTAAVGLSLLAVQENGGSAGRDATARRRANAILDDLQGLQAELLGGRTDPARLVRLAALQAGRREPIRLCVKRSAPLRSAPALNSRGAIGPRT